MNGYWFSQRYQARKTPSGDRLRCRGQRVQATVRTACHQIAEPGAESAASRRSYPREGRRLFRERPPKARFALDSPLEEAGFEPSVPRQGTAFFTGGNELYPLPIN